MSPDPSIFTAEHDLPPEPGERLVRPFLRFARLSSAGGLVMLAMTVLAMLWANSRFAGSYERLFHDTQLAVSVEHHPHIQPGDPTPEPTSQPAPDATGHTADGGVPTPDPSFFIAHGLTHWINDLLMAVFFLVVGLEIKREVLVGELASPRRAALPIFAALGGMIGPALIFTAFNRGDAGAMPGWGVPMATDIAFAVGVMAMLGKRVPNPLKVFLLSLAIVDDLGALIVIAVFYTDSPDFAFLGYAGGLVALLMVMNVLRVRWITLYLLLGLPLWYFVYRSGVHATISGVLLAMTIPAHARVNARAFSDSSRHALDIFESAGDDPDADITTSNTRRAAAYAMITNARQVLPPLHRIETVIHPWAAFFIIPVFALANAGIPLSDGIGQAVSGSVSLGVIAGLVIGKPLGIMLAALIAVKIGLAVLPRGVSWRHMLGAACLGGIGFTMAIFIANLAYENNPVNLEHAKLAILIGSALSAVLGAGVILTCKPRPGPEPDPLGPKTQEG